MKPLDISNKRYGRLIAIERINSKTSNGSYLWNCRCDCGGIKQTTISKLKQGNVKSCGCLHKLPKGESSFNALFYHYKNDAKKRDYEFALSQRYFKWLTKQNCHYCGQKPIQEYRNSKSCHNNGSYIYNGIDRKDNHKGYIEDNVVSCCSICNHMKMDYGYRQFINQCSLIAERRRTQYRIERKDNTST